MHHGAVFGERFPCLSDCYGLLTLCLCICKDDLLVFGLFGFCLLDFRGELVVPVGREPECVQLSKQGLAFVVEC